MPATGNAGFNTVAWNTRMPPAGGGGGGGGGGNPGRGGPTIIELLAPLGEYTVTVNVAGRTLTQKATIVRTQGWSLNGAPVIIRE